MADFISIALSRVAVVFCLSLLLQPAVAAQPTKIAMSADRWQQKGNVEFAQMEGFPLGLIRVNSGSAALNGLNFGDGTIEFDISPIGEDIPGIRFRRRDDHTAEEFYLRPGPNCPASNDCVQYAPVTHGLMLWDIYPEYQTQAPVRTDGWNHIKLVMSKRRMDVFINGAASPTLVVDRLAGDALEGGLQLEGPAIFANLTVSPDAIDSLSAEPAAKDEDHNLVRNWQISAEATLPEGKIPAFADAPAGSPWDTITAERSGLVNLSRKYGSPTERAVSAVAWLRARVESDQPQTKHVSIGWARAIWVFVNGELIFADKNFYYPPSARRNPDGRLALENGSFDLPLQKGANEVVIALSNEFPGSASHWGWGLKLRFDDLDGIGIPADANAQADR